MLQPPPPIPRRLTILLGMFIAIGPAATDMYLPSFPAVEASFGTAAGTAQLTLAAWFAGLAVGQMTQGTLSDRFGRRAPLIGGMALFTLATIGCAMAPSIGGLILIWSDWRVIFWVLAAYGAVSCFMAWRFLPETLPPQRRHRLGLAAQLSRYGIILRERTFLTHAAMGASGEFAMFAYLGGSSSVFIQGFGLSPSEFALIFGLCAIGLAIGSQINARLLPRLRLSFMLTMISRISLTATTTLTVLAFSDVRSLPLIVAPIVVVLTCQGFSNANCSVGALSRHAAHAGSASALMGLGQFSLGATSGLLVGLLTDGTPRGMAALMLCGSLCAVIADLCRPRS